MKCFTTEDMINLVNKNFERLSSKGNNYIISIRNKEFTEVKLGLLPRNISLILDKMYKAPEDYISIKGYNLVHSTSIVLLDNDVIKKVYILLLDNESIIFGKLYWEKIFGEIANELDLESLK